MEQFETRFSQVDVLPMVKHFMDELDLFNLFKRYVPAIRYSMANTWNVITSYLRPVWGQANRKAC